MIPLSVIYQTAQGLNVLAEGEIGRNTHYPIRPTTSSQLYVPRWRSKG